MFSKFMYYRRDQIPFLASLFKNLNIFCIVFFISDLSQKLPSQNGLSSETIGLVFLIAPAMYTVCSPPLGYCTDKKVSSSLSVLGTTMYSVKLYMDLFCYCRVVISFYLVFQIFNVPKFQLAKEGKSLQKVEQK